MKKRAIYLNFVVLMLLIALLLPSCTILPTEQEKDPPALDNGAALEETVALENGVKLSLSDDKNYYIATANGRDVTVEHLVIPAEYGGISIGEVDMMQYEADFVKTISLPDTIFSIGLSSFAGCTRLQYNIYGNARYLGNEENPYLYLIDAVSEDITSVAIHETTRVIAPAAFSDCTQLRDVYIPDSVITIGNIAFYECTALSNVRFGEGLKTIGGKCFYDCEKLTQVDLPDGLVSIGNYGFHGCQILKLDLGKSVETLGEHTFDNALITHIEIPGSLKAIDFCAFRNCMALKTVTINEGVEIIGESAFTGCKELKNLYLPSTVKRIERKAFANCSVLNLSSLPDSVEFIDSSAFPSTISKKVYGNGVYLAQGDSEYAFLVSAKGTAIDLHPEAEKIAYGFVKNYKIEKFTAKSYSNLEVKNSCVINKHTGELVAALDDAVIPDDGSVKSIGDGAFYGLKNLTSVIIPDSVESIGYAAFSGCSSLEQVTIGDGVVNIENGAFCGCGKLTSVRFGKSIEHIGEYAFERTSITEAVLGDSLKSIGDSAFEHCGKLEKVELGGGIESIGKLAFCQSGITELYLPGSLVEISDRAFSYCYDLKEVVIDAKLTELKSLFMGCRALEYVSMPGSVTSLGATFSGCTSLSRIDFDGDINDWNAFGIEGFASEVTIIFANSTTMVLPKIEK